MKEAKAADIFRDTLILLQEDGCLVVFEAEGWLHEAVKCDLLGALLHLRVIEVFLRQGDYVEDCERVDNEGADSTQICLVGLIPKVVDLDGVPKDVFASQKG